MYYHVLVETKEKTGKNKDKNREIYELDKTETTDLLSSIVIPFIKKEEFQFNGYFLKPSDISRISIYETQQTTKELSKWENDHMPRNIIMFVTKEMIVHYDKYSKDVTKEIFTEANELLKTPSLNKSISPNDFSKVFIVHGQDELAKTEVARFIEKLGIEPIILHEQVSLGKTIIEKIEHYSNVNYGIVLYTPCDLGAKNGDSKYNPRARQNVVFEHGYLIAKLNRENVAALVKDEVELPNDISGIVYIEMDAKKAWALLLAKELKKAGYDIDLNKLI